MTRTQAVAWWMVVGIVSCGGLSCGKREIIRVGLPDWTLKSSSSGEVETFLSFPTLRTSHVPGYVFRTGGVWVTTVGDTSDWTVTSEVLPGVDVSVERDFLVGLFNVANLERRGSVRTRLVFDECVRTAVAEDFLTRLLDAANINFKPDRKYFAIQTTISAKRVSVEFDRVSDLDASTRSWIDKLAAGAEYVRREQEQIVLIKDLEVPHQVCYKPVEIRAGGLQSDGRRRISLVPTEQRELQ